jgi:glycosyltransferase involved in cell wall biosynthesis
MGKQFPDLSFIDEGYLGVIFLQSLPPVETLNKLRNTNIMFFPMYDASKDWDRGLWQQIADLKIVSFSKALHEKLAQWHIPSLYLQYFPEPSEFFAGDPKKVFFWQRRTEISFERIKHLFAGQNVSVHIHKALDPYQEFVRPSPEDEKAFNITYSDWYESKEELWEEMKKSAIYIAPREYEGIGMSFLEAMSKGKVVIACDNPTMNEYIQDGKTGYLFKLKKPEPIDLGKVKEVQKNTNDYMKAGYERWIAEREKIVDFLKKE